MASTSWLSKLLRVPAAQLRIASLITKKAITTTVTSAGVSGRLVITWYATVKHKKVVMPAGLQTVLQVAAAHMSIRLTAAGRALLKKSASVMVSVVGRYQFGASSITSSRTLTFKR